MAAAFPWKSATERPDFAYFEEAFRDYPHSNENCSIADWLGGSSTKPTPLLLHLFLRVSVYRSSVFNPRPLPVTSARFQRGAATETGNQAYIYTGVFLPFTTGFSWSSCAILFTIQLSVNSPRTERAFCLARHSSSRSNARPALDYAGQCLRLLFFPLVLRLFSSSSSEERIFVVRYWQIGWRSGAIAEVSRETE